MVSYSSILWALSFFGIGGWILYYTGFKVVLNHIKALQFKHKILNPNLKELDAEINSYADTIKKVELESIKPFLQKFLYIKILSKDIIILRNLTSKEKNVSVKSILARTLALQLYEYYNDLENLYNHKFEQTFLKPVSQNLVDAFQGVKKINTVAKKLYYKKLQKIRLNVIGHRDFDSAKQYDIISSIDTKEILEITNMALFVIYFLTISNVALLKSISNGLKIDVFSIPLFKKYKWDFKQFEFYADYFNKKNTKS